MTIQTPLTEQVRFRLHATFPDWPDEALDAIERYDELARRLELANAGLVKALKELADEVQSGNGDDCKDALREARAAIAAQGKP